MMKTIQIDLPGVNYRYQVKIGNGILRESLLELLSTYTESSIYLITNTTIDELYHGDIMALFPEDITVHSLILPDGEKYKNLNQIEKIYDFLTEKRANRKSILVAVGGGVIGDMAGFGAATYMRGIPYVQVPTTLLSQVDSGIGGKTGINHASGKNLIGAFKQPLQTIIEVDFLKTLPEREIVAGYAELIKHGFIKDAYLFQILRHKSIHDLQNDRALLVESIFRSCEVKARVVEADEKETDERAVLNFGHTLGHFLETYTGYEQFLHGEAVIIGMDFAAWWSRQNGYLDKSDFDIIHEHLTSLGIRHRIPTLDKDMFKRVVEYDKKFAASGIRFVALSGIGSTLIVDHVTSDNIWEVLQSYLNTDSMLRFK